MTRLLGVASALVVALSGGVGAQPLAGTVSPVLAAAYLQLALDELLNAEAALRPSHGDGEAIAADLAPVRGEVDRVVGQLALARLRLADPDQLRELDTMLDQIDDLRDDLDHRAGQVRRDLHELERAALSLLGSLRHQAFQREEVLRRAQPPSLRTRSG